MEMPLYTSQSRLNFDVATLLSMGVKRAYVTPFNSNNELLKDKRFVLSQLENLKKKSDEAIKNGLEVYPFFVTINHPEGNYQIPERYRKQQNIDGSIRTSFICFLDKIRQEEMIDFVTQAAQLGFKRIMFDDDLRDAFCYCDEHIYGFEGFNGKSREQIKQILNEVLSNCKHEQLRKDWYEYKYQGMIDYAKRIEQAVHDINPLCKIGICTSAKRCQDFSGRNPAKWISYFSTEQAPAFVRLCGECYNDSFWSLCQSTGWSQYFNSCYPEEMEKVLEVTSVPAVNFRSPGTVIFEAGISIAATANNNIHWAWPEQFKQTGLCETVAISKDYLLGISKEITDKPESPLCVYVDSNLGPYTPINVSVDFGSISDSINAYNIISLLGIPVIMRPKIPLNQPAIVCASYISRKMIENIDEYVSKGGVAIIDAKAAQCYQLYGGCVPFQIQGPFSLNSYEILPNGDKYGTIADCPPDSVYYVESNKPKYSCQAIDINGNVTGNTTVILESGSGKIIILAYDLSLTKQVFLCYQWRDKILDLLKSTKVKMPVFWSGPVGVQCFDYGNKTGLANYNSNDVEGKLIKGRKTITINLPKSKFELHYW